jgi:cytochrome c oxidase assembly protein subunit 15
MAAFARYCRFVLAYNLAVVVWGAYVRASGSGAGCGSHWPLCNGAVLPTAPAGPAGPSHATLIEYTHRLSSGLVLVLVVALVGAALRLAPPVHPVRRGAWASLLLTLTAAALGAGLVLFRLVARDESLARALFISAHLLNTLLLLAALTLTLHWARDPAGESRGSGTSRRKVDRSGSSWASSWDYTAGLVAVAILGATGAVAALGDTLFPASSLAAGLAADLAPASHLLLRLRAFHPLLALAVGAYLLWLCNRGGVSPAVRRREAAVRFLVLAQLAAGAVNVALLAPVWLQLTHLLLADLLWIALVLLAAEGVAARSAAAPLPALAWNSNIQKITEACE